MLCSSLFTNFFLPFPHFFLGEWVMKLPKFMLTHPQEDGKPLLYHVFASLYAASGVAFRPTKAEKGHKIVGHNLIHFGQTFSPSQLIIAAANVYMLRVKQEPIFEVTNVH